MAKNKSTQPPPPASMKRGPTALTRNRGTGFEDFFADPPMTATEAAEERNEIYHPRIEECIQRFRSRRRLDAELQQFFSAYLFLGGVDTTPRQFMGMLASEVRDMTPSERRELTATDTIHRGGNINARYYNHTQPEHWEVDFTSVAAGFLSETVPVLAGAREFSAIKVVESFLRYVVQHDVCPEYTLDVKNALHLCDTAREELPLVGTLTLAFPGQFNLAAQKLYCRPEEVAFVELTNGFHVPEGFDPKVFFETAVFLAGEEEQVRRLQGVATVHAANERLCDLEVIEINRPDDGLAAVFRGLRIDPPDGPKGVVAPIGKAVFKPCIIQDGFYRPDQPDPATLPNVTLLLDDSILQPMRLGMKFRLQLCDLNVGVTFVKQCRGIFPSFHTFLPQQLMRNYKEPIENPRLPPSVLDPDANEKELSKELKDI